MRINIGCGSLPTDGWKNYDNSFSVRIARIPGLSTLLGPLLSPDHRNFIQFVRTHDIEFADVIRRIPLPDASVEVVYSAHMLEHLHPHEARACIHEIKRVLRPGGIVRLNLPDLEMLARAYVMDGDANTFMAKSMLATPPAETLVRKLRLALIGFRHHLWMYDGRSLCQLLSNCGLFDPQVMKAGTTRIPDPRPLDLYERADQSVFVEAVKR